MCRTRHPHVVILYGQNPFFNLPITRDPNLKTFFGAFTKLANPQISPEKIFESIPPVNSISTTKDFQLRLSIIIDHKLFLQLGGSRQHCANYAGRVVNQMALFFQQSRLQVSLWSVEGWNAADRFVVTDKIRVTLHHLLNYSLGETDRSWDSVLLLSSKVFTEDTAHLSVPDSVCTSNRQVAVVQVMHLSDVLQVAKLASLATAEQMGLQAFPCPPTGCTEIFGEWDMRRLEAAFRTGLSDCLYNRAKPMTQPFCGNSKIERTEECESTDLACCNPKLCLLLPHATCKAGSCCRNCTLEAAGKVCRLARSTCDLPELCDGGQGSCPTDHTLENLQQCPGGVCWDGECPSRDRQCQLVWGSTSSSANTLCYGTAQRDECAPLMCQGGASKPQHSSYSGLTVNTLLTQAPNGSSVSLECKFLSPDRVMVRPGSACSKGACHQSRCQMYKDLQADSRCPDACSSRGVCTTMGSCLCKPGFQGPACEQGSNFTSRLQDLFWNGEKGSSASPPAADNTLTTVYLIIILGSVIVIVFIILFVFMICYKRQSGSSSLRTNRRGRRGGKQDQDVADRVTFGLTPHKEYSFENGLDCQTSPMLEPMVEKRIPDKGILKNRDAGEIQSLTNQLLRNKHDSMTSVEDYEDDIQSQKKRFAPVIMCNSGQQTEPDAEACSDPEADRNWPSWRGSNAGTCDSDGLCGPDADLMQLASRLGVRPLNLNLTYSNIKPDLALKPGLGSPAGQAPQRRTSYSRATDEAC